PFVAFFLVMIWPNALWSIANLLYNEKLIVDKNCDDGQKYAFWQFGVPIYTALSWMAGLGLCVWLIRPLAAFYRALEGAGAMTPTIKYQAQRRLINLPWYQLLSNFLLWLPGGVYFPLM